MTSETCSHGHGLDERRTTRALVHKKQQQQLDTHRPGAVKLKDEKHSNKTRETRIHGQIRLTTSALARSKSWATNGRGDDRAGNGSSRDRKERPN